MNKIRIIKKLSFMLAATFLCMQGIPATAMQLFGNNNPNHLYGRQLREEERKLRRQLSNENSNDYSWTKRYVVTPIRSICNGAIVGGGAAAITTLPWTIARLVYGKQELNPGAGTCLGLYWLGSTAYLGTKFDLLMRNRMAYKDQAHYKGLYEGSKLISGALAAIIQLKPKEAATAAKKALECSNVVVKKTLGWLGTQLKSGFIYTGEKLDELKEWLTKSEVPKKVVPKIETPQIFENNNPGFENNNPGRSKITKIIKAGSYAAQNIANKPAPKKNMIKTAWNGLKRFLQGQAEKGVPFRSYQSLENGLVAGTRLNLNNRPTQPSK